MPVSKIIDIMCRKWDVVDKWVENSRWVFLFSNGVKVVLGPAE
jgi:hypothetical protein